jgi:hypothetical protein
LVRLALAFSLVFAVLCAPTASLAQTTGDVSGTVYDQTGASLPGFFVSVRGPRTRNVPTNEAGGFEFQGLPEGDYDIAAELSGFQIG